MKEIETYDDLLSEAAKVLGVDKKELEAALDEAFAPMVEANRACERITEEDLRIIINSN
jgi:hypothetical protein